MGQRLAFNSLAKWRHFGSSGKIAPDFPRPLYLVVTSHQFPLRVKDHVGVVLIATVAGAAGITGIT